MKKYILLIALAAYCRRRASPKRRIRSAEENFRASDHGGWRRRPVEHDQGPHDVDGDRYLLRHGRERMRFVSQYASYWPKRWYRQLVEGQFAIGVAGDQVTMFRGGGIRTARSFPVEMH